MLPSDYHYLFFARIQLLQKVVALRVPDPDLRPLHSLIVVVKDLVAQSVSNLKKIYPFLFFQVKDRCDMLKFLLEELLIL
jgi:hypothetical protein